MGNKQCIHLNPLHWSNLNRTRIFSSLLSLKSAKCVPSGLDLTFTKMQLLIIFGIVFTLFSAGSGQEGKSLFDDLPLNGAYSPSATIIESEIVLPKSTSFVSPKKITKQEPTTSEIENSATDEIGSESYEESQSLFNDMPNKGALPSTSGDLNVSESQVRNQKRSFGAPQLLIRSDSAAKGVQLEIEKLTPTTMHTFSNLNRNFLPLPIIDSGDFPHTVVSPIVTHQKPPGPIVLSHPLPLPTRTGHHRPYPANAFEAIPVRSNNGRGTRRRNPSITLFGTTTTTTTTSPISQREKEVRRYHFRAPPRRPNFLRPNTRNSYPPAQNEGVSGGYADSVQITTPSTTSTTTSTTLPQSTTVQIYPTTPPHSSSTTIFPIITTPTSTASSSKPGGGSDYDYETLDDKPHRQFNSRTGSAIFDFGFGLEPGTTGQRNSLNIPKPQLHFSPPSASYVPPSSPSVTYGPPEPAPSYGPPQEPAPSYGPPPELPVVAEPPAPPPPSNTGTTSISYQTIPIQTVTTQLVTVPHVTISASTSDPDGQSDSISRPQSPGRPLGPSRPASIAYGPPGTRNDLFNPSRGGLAAQSLFTDDQIAALLSVAGGTSTADSGNQFDDDTIASLISDVRGSGNIFSGGNIHSSGNILDRGILGSNNIIGGGNILSGGNIVDARDLLGEANIFGNNLGLRQNGNGPRRGNPRNRFLNRVRNNNGISNDQLLLSALINQQRNSERLNANRVVNLPTRFRGETILTGDAVDAVSDIIREQRLRGAISDLSGRLRLQKRNAYRANERYKSLFYKGALLLSALTLLPAVASPIASAAVNSASNGFLLPLASGRRRRDVLEVQQLSPFENCKWQSENYPDFASHSFNAWFNCALNATELVFEEHMNNSGTVDNGTPLLKDVPTSEILREDLKNTVSPDEIIKNSKCLQKRFCETILEVETLPNAESILFLYSIFASDVENNPWIRESMAAAKTDNCGIFVCSD